MKKIIRRIFYLIKMVFVVGWLLRNGIIDFLIFDVYYSEVCCWIIWEFVMNESFFFVFFLFVENLGNFCLLECREIFLYGNICCEDNMRCCLIVLFIFGVRWYWWFCVKFNCRFFNILKLLYVIILFCWGDYEFYFSWEFVNFFDLCLWYVE